MKKDHGIEHIGLCDAYDALSQEAFAIWMRLHLFTDEQLNSGRLRIASMTGYSESRLNAILRELKLAGFLTFHPSDRPGNTTVIKFAKVCKISGRNRFVKLSNFLLTGHGPASIDSEPYLPMPLAQNGFDDTSKQSMTCVDVKSSDAQGKVECEPVQRHVAESMARSTLGCGSADMPVNLFNSVKSGMNSGDDQECDLLQEDDEPSNSGQHGDFERPRRIKFYTLDGGITPVSEPAHDSETITHLSKRKGGLDLSLFSKSSRAKRDSSPAKTSPKHPDVGKPIDWTRLDQWGKPQVTFSPSERKREQMVTLLTGDSRRLSPAERKLRKDMESKLESEFIRMYERYRRMVLRERGHAKTKYEVMAGERKYALKAAVACVVKGVTPRQVLEYWHNHIGNFADSKMPVPPITFLSQPANIDTVCIDVMSSRHDAPPRARSRSRVPSMHTMSDTTLLHPKLRRALMDEGFDLTDMNDSYLTTIQAYAIDIVSGAVKERLIPSRIRGMVKWAAEHFYAGVNVKDYI